ncbi:SICA antigen [Plasmodium coatneyi]|uniref:SICA antigen n=1 Tax=Plasmodium coatneyi TaxID=208452 RepID=A0A1B1E7V7_9APIC|nr:SICA antigen [Plasmodium coatneyi]ANQ11047.1 SICA antigen [Plasmodium coatneyi]
MNQWESICRISHFKLYYFTFPGKRRLHKRVHQVRGRPFLREEPLDHVDDQADGSREYYIVKERKPRSTPKKRRKKRAGGRRRVGRHRPVGRRTIIDIHLEVLGECQKGDLHSRKEDFFEILVQEFMGSNFIKEVQCFGSDSGFREEDFVPREDVPEEQVQCSDFGCRKEDFVPKEGVPKEQVPSSDSGTGSMFSSLRKKFLRNKLLRKIFLWKEFLRKRTFQVQIPDNIRQDNTQLGE